MQKTFLPLAAAFVALAGFHQASAGERYRVVAPVVIGDSLTAPWVNQLGAPASAYRAAAGYRPRVVAPVAAPAGRDYRRELRPATQQVAYQRPDNPVRSQLDPQFLPQVVDYQSSQKPGSIFIDTDNRFLYLIEGNGKARRYGVGVGKPGFEWAGSHKVTRKAEWPDWTPPSAMIKREAARGHYLPAHMEGGPANPLGARAMYLGSTEYRIHGTNAPWTIGYAVSSGCIRMRNEDVVDLYSRVKVGANVVVK